MSDPSGNGWKFAVEVKRSEINANRGPICLIDLFDNDDRGDVEPYIDSKTGRLHCTLGCEEDGEQLEIVNVWHWVDFASVNDKFGTCVPIDMNEFVHLVCEASAFDDYSEKDISELKKSYGLKDRNSRMLVEDLRIVFGNTVRGWYKQLDRDQEGCIDVCYAQSCTCSFHVVFGFHDTTGVPKNGEKRVFKLAWKIGIQRPGSVMKTDFDIDYDVPKNHESGEVDDTTEIVELSPDGEHPVGYGSWDELADKIRKEADRVFRVWG